MGTSIEMQYQWIRCSASTAGARSSDFPEASPVAGPSASRTLPVVGTQLDPVQEFGAARGLHCRVVRTVRQGPGALPLLLDLAFERRRRRDARGDARAHETLVVQALELGHHCRREQRDDGG